jgi:hypothetical protein
VGNKKPRQVLLNGKLLQHIITTQNSDEIADIAVTFVAGKTNDKIVVEW